MLLHHDGPIKGDTQFPDLLNRVSFSKRVSDAITGLSPDSGFVISIEGPWGYGKTSVINLIQKEFESLPKENQPIVTNFNPWMIGNVDSLAHIFLTQIASSIGLSHNSEVAKKAASELLSYSSLFSALRFLPGAEPWASIIKTTIEAVGTATDKVADLKELNTEKKRDAVINALEELDKRIVIFIDDIDRLPPQEVFEMVRLVKAVGDFPNIIYVLCFDTGYVTKALEVHHIANAAAYLDKIIQTRLTLPLIDAEDLLSILNRDYESLPEEARKEYFPKVSERVGEVYHYGLKQLLETPRDIKRLFNRLLFIEPGCRREVNLADLLALEAIAIKAPQVYQHIKINPAAYLGTSNNPNEAFNKPEEIIQSYENERQMVLEPLPTNLQNAVAGLLKYIFPRIAERAFDSSLNHASARGLICSLDRLSIALSAGLPSQEVALGLAHDFIHSSDRRRILNEALASHKIGRLVEHIQELIPDNEINDVVNIAKALGDMIDSPAGIAVETASKDLFTPRLSKRSWWVVEAMLEKLPLAERKTSIIAVIETPDQVSFPTLALSLLHAQHGGFQDESRLADKDCWVSKITLDNLSLAWANSMVSKVTDGTIFKSALPGIALHRLKLFHPDILKRQIKSLLSNDLLLDQLSFAIALGGADSIKGKFAELEDDEIEFFGGKKLKLRARERLKDTSISQELRHVYTAIQSGKRIYLIDGSVGEKF